MDGTIGSDYVIKPVPSNVELSTVQLDEFTGRDDDEMFLDEDELGSLSQSSNHENNLKSSTKKNKKQQQQQKNKTSSQNDLINDSRPPNSSSKVPKLHKLDNDNSNIDNEFKSKKFKKLELRNQLERSAHIVYKKWKQPKETHSDFIELEPGSHGYHGHFVPNSNWTLLHQFPKPKPTNQESKYSNSTNQNVQFDENLYDELEAAHSFNSMRYSSSSSDSPLRRSKRQAPDTVWPGKFFF